MVSPPEINIGTCSFKDLCTADKDNQTSISPEGETFFMTLCTCQILMLDVASSGCFYEGKAQVGVEYCVSQNIDDTFMKCVF